ncbi:ABC transporter ATP-binding protein [Flavonifractor sp. An10]|uniref:ABC transporter ATP-binding protein n=1 Tax=Flavonifractor sp. An10 TaxID=1965537 RepID=UPI000B393679|nr:ABC transporter ATP-binding protein [Flavonifractor sp. An10]OUQ79359.1 macrolide ABC transporter ATP-binding protein [Flavonifractor sp. An10]
MSLIQLEQIYKIYNEGKENEVRALNGVTLSIGRGEFVSIIGASGSGKSTLMNVLGCLDLPTRGSYHLNGKLASRMNDDELSHIRNVEIGFIFQGYNLIPALDALENVELPLIYQGVGAEKRARIAREALERVGLGDRVHNYPSQMSGGQQQRVAIARAISTGAPILMADEPTGALDSKTGEQVLGILRQLHKEQGTTVLLITHDNKVAAAAERVIRIADGQIVVDCPREEIAL